MQTAIGGVKTIKIYGKQGRRIRAKERLEAQIKSDEIQIEIFNKEKTKHENDPRFYKEDRYREIVRRIGILFKCIGKAKQELETLKSRI